jgi:hypothetical protein
MKILSGRKGGVGTFRSNQNVDLSNIRKIPAVNLAGILYIYLFGL